MEKHKMFIKKVGSLSIADRLWGEKASFLPLFLASLILLFSFLGAHEIWTQEHRWADIVQAMFYYHDFLHPILNGQEYYDKPLLSYWMMAFFSLFNQGEVTTWALRLPSALSGLLAIFSIYWLGCSLHSKRLGLLAGWLLLTTFFFVFWARVSSSDMLNLGGTLFGVAWYFDKKNQPDTFLNYLIFFLILSVTGLCKGLVGPLLILIAIFPDVLTSRTWRNHLNGRMVLAAMLAIMLYVLPFWLSNHFAKVGYSENGLYEVYRENVMRYFKPFDHQGPIYLYFIYLPLYLLPWTFFFIPALISLKGRWSAMPSYSKWIVYATLLIFLFFTLSGSRRSYYILPLVPFAILLTADWILRGDEGAKKISLWVGRIVVSFFIGLFLIFCILQPLYYSFTGTAVFTKHLKKEATQIKPWSEWNVVLLDANSKVAFYLQLSPQTENAGRHSKLALTNKEELLTTWPILKAPIKNTIFITRQQYAPLLKAYFKKAQVVDEPTLFKHKGKNDSVALLAQ
jgi:4-amino-4-deoxy-L-arabinose transferase-like glycosyltransferase